MSIDIKVIGYGALAIIAVGAVIALIGYIETAKAELLSFAGGIALLVVIAVIALALIKKR